MVTGIRIRNAFPDVLCFLLASLKLNPCFYNTEHLVLSIQYPEGKSNLNGRSLWSSWFKTTSFPCAKNAIWDTSTGLWICQMPTARNLKYTISNTDKSPISLPHPSKYTPEQPSQMTYYEGYLGKKLSNYHHRKLHSKSMDIYIAQLQTNLPLIDLQCHLSYCSWNTIFPSLCQFKQQILISMFLLFLSSSQLFALNHFPIVIIQTLFPWKMCFHWLTFHLLPDLASAGPLLIRRKRLPRSVWYLQYIVFSLLSFRFLNSW